MSGVRRVLVVRAGGLGDTLLTAPAILALHARHPGMRITAVGHRQAWDALGSLVDRVISVDLPTAGGLIGGVPSPQTLALVREHDLVVLWTSSTPHPDLLEVGTPLVHGSPYPPPGVHAARWLIETLGMTGDPLPVPPLHVSPGDTAAARHLLHLLLGSADAVPMLVHPGAGAPWKRWPAARFASTIERLRADGQQVLLIEGPADESAVTEVNSLLETASPVVRDVPPGPLAALSAVARAYLGNDSGTTHLAAIAGARVVALFGPTDPANWAPVGWEGRPPSPSHDTQGDSLRDGQGGRSSPVTVLRSCTRAATHQGQIRVCDDPACLAGIRVDEVVSALHRVSQQARPDHASVPC